MKKHLNKEEIINTAFIEWGKSSFKNMSLSIIAAKLKITKAALYRYYSNKEELIHNMKDFLSNELSNISSTFINESADLNPEEIISLYITKYFSFFGSNIYYFYFYLTFISRSDYYQKKEIFDILKRINDIFSGVLLKTNSWIKPEESDFFVKFVFSTGIFVLINQIFISQKINQLNSSLTEKDLKEVINKIILIIKNGFGQKKYFKNIDFDKLEKTFYAKIDNLNRNQIFEAIATVVAKEGLWNASISKIANEMKINKSNLYFYFKNKNQMIDQMIIKEIEYINNITTNKTSTIDDFEEKVYIAMLLFASYLITDKRILLVFDWLHYQKNNFKDLKKKISNSNYLSNLFKLKDSNDFLNLNIFNEYFIAGFINMQIVKEILISDMMNIEVSAKNFRYIFKYIFNGLKEKK